MLVKARSGSEVLVLVQRDGQHVYIHPKKRRGGIGVRPSGARPDVTRLTPFNFSYCCVFCSSSPWGQDDKLLLSDQS